MAHYPGALGDPLADVDQLDLVGVDDVDFGVPRRQRRNRLTAPLGLRDIGGQRITGGYRDHLTDVPSLV